MTRLAAALAKAGSRLRTMLGDLTASELTACRRALAALRRVLP